MMYVLLLLHIALAAFPCIIAAPAPAGWTFVQNGTTGIVAIETVIVSPTLALILDRAQNDPLQLDGFSAWGAFWNLKTNTASPVSLVSDTFCGSGGFLSNGTMVSNMDCCRVSVPLMSFLFEGQHRRKSPGEPSNGT